MFVAAMGAWAFVFFINRFETIALIRSEVSDTRQIDTNLNYGYRSVNK